jgi:hypothetical protein
MIYFGCPNCGAPMASPESLAGENEKCPECGNVAVVPQNQAAPSALAQSRVTPVEVRPVNDLSHLSASPPIHKAQVQHTHHGKVQVETKGVNGLGLASLILGIIAVLGCWIPLLNVISIILASLGIIFGLLGFFIALVGRKSGVGLPVSGLIICLTTIFIAVGINTAISSAIQEANDAQQAESVIPPN